MIGGPFKLPSGCVFGDVRVKTATRIGSWRTVGPGIVLFLYMYYYFFGVGSLIKTKAPVCPTEAL